VLSNVHVVRDPDIQRGYVVKQFHGVMNGWIRPVSFVRSLVYCSESFVRLFQYEL
jgi:hypothetical protein